MTYAAAFAAVACFAIVLHWLNVLRVASRAGETARDAARVMRDSVLSDREKEQSIRMASLVLVRCFGSIVARSGIALVASFVPLLVLDVTGVVRLSAVNDVLMSRTGALLAAAGMPLMFFGRARR